MTRELLTNEFNRILEANYSLSRNGLAKMIRKNLKTVEETKDAALITEMLKRLSKAEIELEEIKFMKEEVEDFLIENDTTAGLLSVAMRRHSSFVRSALNRHVHSKVKEIYDYTKSGAFFKTEQANTKTKYRPVIKKKEMTKAERDAIREIMMEKLIAHEQELPIRSITRCEGNCEKCAEIKKLGLAIC